MHFKDRCYNLVYVNRSSLQKSDFAMNACRKCVRGQKRCQRPGRRQIVKQSKRKMYSDLRLYFKYRLLSKLFMDDNKINFITHDPRRAVSLPRLNLLTRTEYITNDFALFKMTHV